MKTRNILTMLLLCVSFCTATAHADALDDGLEQLFLTAYPEMYTQVQESQEQYLTEQGELSFALDDPVWSRKYPPKKILEMRAEYHRDSAGVLDEAVKLYFMDEIRYAKQYTRQGAFSYLFSEPVWAMPKQMSEKKSTFYNMNAQCADNEVFGYTYPSGEYIRNRVYQGAVYQEGREFLRDHERIRTMMSEADAGEFIDCKLVAVTPRTTVLYLTYTNGEYGIIVREEGEIPENFLTVLKTRIFTVHPMQDIITAIVEVPGVAISEEKMLDTKPTYEAEAQFLQEQGLLNGNENGLDLLKPLSRIEATTLLVRALGLEQETAQASVFSDVPDTHWGAGYAMRAYENGIVRGVSDTEFAPEQKVTSNQFATMVLRANGEDADWTQATQILIDRGIITAEQAEKMDWFTRGDMAKIVYEAKTKGLI